MKLSITLLTLSAVLLSFLPSTRNCMKPVKSKLQEMVYEQETPSVQYLFFDTDSVIFEFRQGLSDVRSGKNIEASSRYHLFSITKTFTALAVMQLVQEGKVDLEKPVVAYLPEFPYPKEITVEQLVSHTAGVPNPLPLRWIHLPGEHDTFNRDAFFAEVFRKHPTPDYAAGTKFKYSNLGYVFLGQLIERVSGMTFEAYVNTNIVSRCGIAREELSFELDTTRHATGYQKYYSAMNAMLGLMIDKPKFMGKREGSWKPFKPFYNNGIAYGGLFGTGEALMMYAQALLRKDSPLLSDSLKKVLLTEGRIDGKPTGMAHSWFTGSLNGHGYFAHAGGGGGYYVELRIYPELGVGSVVLLNRTGVRDERMLSKLDVSFLPQMSSSANLAY